MRARLLAIAAAVSALQKPPRPLLAPQRSTAQTYVAAAPPSVPPDPLPVVWGTYAPAVKAVYALPAPPPGVVFSGFYYVVALAVLSAARAANAPREGAVPWRAGFELGGYLFLGNLCQVAGLETVSADAAAFLVQTTTVLVPVLETTKSGRAVARGTALRCAVAFLGVAVLCGEGLAENAQLAEGDALIVLAALFYSVHVVRLSEIASNIDALDLASSKAAAECGFALASIAALFFFTPFDAGRAFFDALPAADAATLGALATATLWCGGVTCAYTIWAQSFGQRDVPASRANLVYTSQPVFSALFALALLGERPTPATLLGGGLILAAVAAEVADDDPT